MYDIALWIALAAALLSCYFAACTHALKTFNRSRLIERLEAMGRGHRIAFFTDRADDLALLTGIVRSCLNMAVVLCTLLWVEGRWPDHGRPAIYLAAFIVAGLFVTVFGVAVAGSLSRYRSEAILAGSSGLLSLMLRLLKPLVFALHGLDPIIRRIFGVNLHEELNAASQEVLSVVEEHEVDGVVDNAQKQMIEAVFDLPTTTAGEIMTPRTEVQGLPLDASVQQIKDGILRDGHSRIPVYDRTIDNIVGILFAKDLIKFLGPGEAFDLRSVLREPLMVPETKPVRELLTEFKTRKVHMAIVLDEYGGTAGLVTIEDIIEELVGEIADEYDTAHDEPNITRVDEKTLDVDARVRFTDLAEELGLTLPEELDYDTVGGFVFSTLGHIPTAGEQFEHESLRFTVTDAGRTRVNRVRVEKLSADAAASGMQGEHRGGHG
ncbi:MAG: hemolysin family protein [Planctomycetota bacterium]|nr:hemolysin family protein [Planctomycetota bacterium]